MTPTDSPTRVDVETLHRDFEVAEARGREAARREAERARQEAREQEAREQRKTREVREAEFIRRRNMTQLQWTGDRLEPGDIPESHFARVEDVLGLDNTGSFVYPDDHADAALRGTLDMRPGSRAIRLFMLSLDQDLAADLRSKDGLVADAENQLQVQAFAVPDVAAVAFRRFSLCSMGQLLKGLAEFVRSLKGVIA